MKRSILIQNIPTTRPISYDQDPKPGARDVLEITVEYTTGGTSYFTGQRHQRGYRISASPYRIDGNSKSCILCGKGGGIYHFLQEAARFHQGTLVKLAAGIKDTPEYQKLIESCLAHNHCHRTDQAQEAPAPVAAPVMHKMHSSPWGKVDGWSRFGDLGLFHHSTPGHGGIYVPPDMKRLMPKPYRDANQYGGGGWFEEDCEWALVALSFPSGLDEKTMENARSAVKNYHPHAYMAVTGEKLTRKDSSKLAEDEDRAAAAGKYVVVSAIGSGSTFGGRFIVPEGWVGCFAVLGGRDKHGRYDESTARYFLVPHDEYQTRTSFGFIIEKDYPAWPAADEAAPAAPPTKRIDPERAAKALALFAAA